MKRTIGILLLQSLELYDNFCCIIWQVNYVQTETNCNLSLFVQFVWKPSTMNLAWNNICTEQKKQLSFHKVISRILKLSYCYIIHFNFFIFHKPSICFLNIVTMFFGLAWPFRLSHLFNRRSIQSPVTRCWNEQALLRKVRTSCKNNVLFHSHHSNRLQPHTYRHSDTHDSTNKSVIVRWSCSVGGVSDLDPGNWDVKVVELHVLWSFE